jgi:hypothetical protein
MTKIKNWFKQNFHFGRTREDRILCRAVCMCGCMLLAYASLFMMAAPDIPMEVCWVFYFIFHHIGFRFWSANDKELEIVELE